MITAAVLAMDDNTHDVLGGGLMLLFWAFIAWMIFRD